MSDQIPLYLGIPLAMLCVSMFAAVLLIGIAIWRDR